MANRSRLIEGCNMRWWFRCRLWVWWGGIVVAVVVLLALVCTALTHTYTNYLLRSLEGPLPADDPELLTYIREELLQPPSSEPYDLLEKRNVAQILVEESEVFYNKSLRTLFKDKSDGFFVEAGALDGETMSNTLWLERELGWTGLLVEADRTAYLSLITKHRRAWAANVCLAPTPYPSKEMFYIYPHYPGPLALSLGFKMRSMHGLTKYNEKATSSSWFTKVQCIPLESILLSLGVTRVDLLVLDVEGAELAILGHFDLQKFNVLCIEWKKKHEIDSVVQQFKKRGYVEAARLDEDIILVQHGSQYEGRLNTSTHS
ncbi:Star-like 17 [Homarus americanus]|uniref:Star-like 17 n=1 Tax=Homarus americanus TaxID=6706 RepID=A0A8J5JRJ7_HOMAM|nr:Star-like 17 [Homarus americanus]